MVGGGPPDWEWVTLPNGKRIRRRKGWGLAFGPDEITALGVAAWKERLDAVGYVEERPPGFENRGPLKPGELLPPRAR